VVAAKTPPIGKAMTSSVPDHVVPIPRDAPDAHLEFPGELSGAHPAAPDLPSDVPPEAHAEELHAKLRKLERRDWWLWGAAVVVMLLLTVAVISLSFPGLLKVDDPFFQSSLNRAVRGLIELVLLFNAYTIYQQVTIKRMRRQFSEQVSAMGNLRLRAEEFYRQATTDPLTGLANRRTAEERLTNEAARSQRHGYPLTVVAFDLNHFKQINDRHGHPAGDLVLREFARRLARSVRASDLAVRMGGDEFLALLPECTIDQVPVLLARLRPIEVNFQGTRIPVKFSAGCVGYQQGETPEQFLARADRTLYADKRAGKAREAALRSR
jgi:diguanylate cyclase (GGDEF)-like protein